MSEERKLIPLGTMIKPYGIVSAVGWVGERYYWLTSGRSVAMIPASVLEPCWTARRTDAGGSKA